jgi:hypothetical protein
MQSEISPMVWTPFTVASFLAVDDSAESGTLYWLALTGGKVVMGSYEWLQGRNPDGFNTLERGRVGPRTSRTSWHSCVLRRPDSPNSMAPDRACPHV